MSASPNPHTHLLDWEQIETVLLDMDGTLLDLHFDNFFWLEHVPRRYAEVLNTDEDRARNQLLSKMHDTKGSLNWYCLDYWSQELQLDIPQLKAEIQHLISIRPHVEEFLETLHQGPRRVLLVTNAHRGALHLKLDKTGLQPWFDAVISSHDLARPKEDPMFWSELAKLEAFDPATTLLIDDNASVLDSAGEYGIRYLLTLLQPDSQRAARTDVSHPAILHFDELLPALKTNQDIA